MATLILMLNAKNLKFYYTRTVLPKSLMEIIYYLINIFLNNISSTQNGRTKHSCFKCQTVDIKIA